jgi:hypothetical protein
MKFRQTDTVPIAAAKAGFGTATGYRIERDARLPSTRKLPAAGAGAIPWPMSGRPRSCRC